MSCLRYKTRFHQAHLAVSSTEDSQAVDAITSVPKGCDLWPGKEQKTATCRDLLTGLDFLSLFFSFSFFLTDRVRYQTTQTKCRQDTCP